jgi:hypothetical protein
LTGTILSREFGTTDMAGLAAKQSGESSENTHAPTDLKAANTDFRQRVRTQYREAMVQIDSALDVVIARSRAQIDRSGDPISPTDVQNLLETAVAVYTAKCGPLGRSSAASLILKAINRCLDQQESCQGIAKAPQR